MEILTERDVVRANVSVREKKGEREFGDGREQLGEQRALQLREACLEG